MLVTNAQRARIRVLLRAEERSQAWLARKLGMNETLIGHYLAARRPAPVDLLARIAGVLGASESELRGEEEPVAA